MIAETTEVLIDRENIGREVSFKINASAHIMKILRDGIYTNKILAVVREYSCNAVEAHILNNNQSLPIEITLPNFLEPMFKVRDFGPGLDFKQIHNLICTYGSTTKDKSNEFIGMMGIGSKAAFCYTNTFQITSVFNGKKLILNAYLDETEKGKISELFNGDAELNELSGIEIAVRVKNQDISSFVVTCKEFFRFWNILPVFKGDITFKVDLPEYHIKEDSQWGFIKLPYSNYPSEKSYLVMGGISYRIQPSSIPELDSIHHTILEKSLVIFCNIGDVTIAANREEVSYTDKTKSYIKTAIRKIEEQMRTKVDESFTAATNEYQIRELYYKYFGGGVLDSFVHTLLKDSHRVDFAGSRINSHLIEIDQDSMWYITEYYGRYYKGRTSLKSKTVNCVDIFTKKRELSQGGLFYIIGCAIECDKLVKYYKKNGNDYDNFNIQIIKFKSDVERLAWETKVGIPSGTFKELTSTVVIPPKIKQPRKPKEANPKTNCAVYDGENLLDKTNKGCQYYDNKGWNFFDVDVKAEGGYFLIKHYSHLYLNPVEKTVMRAHNEDTYWMNVVKMLMELCPDFATRPVVYAFNESDLGKIKNNHKWIPLKELAIKELQTQQDLFDNASVPLNPACFDPELRIVYEMIRAGFTKSFPSKVKSLLKEFDTESQAIKRYQDCFFLPIIKKDYNVGKIDELKALLQKEVEKYPLIKLISSYYQSDTNAFKELSVYIQAKKNDEPF